MGRIRNKANEVYADTRNGDPLFPRKPEIRDLFGTVEDVAGGAEAAADRAEQALLEIEEIAAGAPDAPSIVNKANRDFDNLDTADAAVNFQAGLDIRQFGAPMDGAGDDLAGILLAIDRAVDEGLPSIRASGSYLRLTADVDCQGLDVICDGTILYDNGHVLYNGFVSNLIVKNYRSDAPIIASAMPAANSPKIIAEGVLTSSPDDIFVISRGGTGHGTMLQMIRRNVSAPSQPTSSMGVNFELWRAGNVLRVADAFAYYRTASASTGTWTDEQVDGVYVLDDTTGVTTRRAVMAWTATAAASRSFQVNVGRDGKLPLGFLQTTAGPSALPIKVDGITIDTINLRPASAGNSGLVRKVYQVAAGLRTITIDYAAGEGGGGGNKLWLIGPNFDRLDEISERRQYDSCGVYTLGGSYIANTGASDYAIRNNANLLWAGSYHGGETERAAPVWMLDGAAIDPTDGVVRVGVNLSIFQQTTLTWTSGETVDVTSLTRLRDSQKVMNFVFDGDVLVRDGYFGMTTSSTNFDWCWPSGDILPPASFDDSNYLQGPTNKILQRAISTPAHGGVIESVVALRLGDMARSAQLPYPHVNDDSSYHKSYFTWAFYRPTRLEKDAAELIQTFS